MTAIKPAEASNALSRVAAVIRRDLVTELSHQYAFAMRYVTIFFSIATFYFLARIVGDAPQLAQYSGRYFEFALVGLIMAGLTSVSLTAYNEAVAAEMGSGTLEILLATATHHVPLVLGTLVTPIGLRLIDAGIYLGLGVGVLGAGFSALGVLYAIPLVLLVITTFAGLGLIAAAFVVLTKRGDPITGLVAQTTNLLAGTIFPVTVLPESLQLLSKLIPTFYALRGLRAVLLEGAGFNQVLDEMAILAGFTAVLVPFGLWLFSRAIKVAKVAGTLGTN